MNEDLQIDRVITDATLRGISVLDYDLLIDKKVEDLDILRAIMTRQNITDPKSCIALENEIDRLQKQSKEWVASVGLKTYGACKIVILIEQLE
jgi:hypothetical protein